uniref:Small ribosomal subunit protein uS4m n=1 Tax=Blastobotrys adeninivorans TaxID=409370 RepID=A0A060T326_BLAAD
MPKRQDLLYSLARKRIRASFNKFNLYNAMTWTRRKAQRRGTLYQQKWTAKQETRAYHGEKLTETQFRNIFNAELNGVSPLKSTIQSEEADVAQNRETPWALQTYLAVERRLDTAVFRSFFAASPRQAAQFIVKGQVKVNGVKIRQPGYVLKAGDVFSVDPEHVLYAMGRKKPSVQESVALVNRQIKKYNRYLARCRKYPETMWKLHIKNRKKHPALYNRLLVQKRKQAEEHNKQLLKKMNSEIDQITPVKMLETILRNEAHFDKHGTLPMTGPLLTKSLSVLSLVTGKKIPLQQSKEEKDKETNNKDAAEAVKETEKVENVDNVEAEAKVEVDEKAEVKAQDKVEQTTEKVEETVEKSEATTVEQKPVDDRIKGIVNRYYGKTESSPGNKSDVKELVKQVVDLQRDQIQKSHVSKLRRLDELESETEPFDPKWIERLPEPLPLVDASAAEEDANSVLPIRLPWSQGKLYGRVDESKGYFTPWSPRPFLSPFAILPHHIEISFETCHAVYLRDPVARPGHSEIISPFPLDMHDRAFMFYLPKRRKYL